MSGLKAFCCFFMKFISRWPPFLSLCTIKLLALYCIQTVHNIIDEQQTFERGPGIFHVNEGRKSLFAAGIDKYSTPIAHSTVVKRSRAAAAASVVMETKLNNGKGSKVRHAGATFVRNT
jgi:hypothetical protein